MTDQRARQIIAVVAEVARSGWSLWGHLDFPSHYQSIYESNEFPDLALRIIGPRGPRSKVEPERVFIVGSGTYPTLEEACVALVDADPEATWR